MKVLSEFHKTAISFRSDILNSGSNINQGIIIQSFNESELSVLEVIMSVTLNKRKISPISFVSFSDEISIHSEKEFINFY
jgi:hypothetical protein